MEERYRGRQEVGWRTLIQWNYLSRLGAVLGRGRVKTATNAAARIRAVKLATDLSLAMKSKGRNAWSRAILGKYLLRLEKSRSQLRVVTYRRNYHRTRRSASAETRPFAPTAVCKKFTRQLVRSASGTGHDCEEEAGGTVTSRLQILRLLVPGSRGLDTPVFLKEAADYISALKKQVQAMQAIADCYSNSSAHAAFQV